MRNAVLTSVVFLLCTVGTFANASRLFDIFTMIAVGIGTFLLRRLGYHVAPFVLGLVSGSLRDKSLRRGLVLSDGSITPFLTRPISAGLVLVTLLTLLLYVPTFKVALRRAGRDVCQVVRRKMM